MSTKRQTFGRFRRYVIEVDFGIDGCKSKRELRAGEYAVRNMLEKTVRDAIRVGPYSKAVTARIADVP